MPIAPFVAAVVALLALSSPVFAQAVPNVPPEDGWVAIVISILMIVAVLVASFMSSKRGHQD